MIREELQPFSPQAQKIIPGIYEHYKGNRYRVINLARHSETLEEVVIYQALYGEYGLWIRPVTVWCRTVPIGNKETPRFRFISSAE